MCIRDSIRIVESFLTERKMGIKIDKTVYSTRDIRGGSPQGSILGCYLYCATTQQLNADLQNHDNPPRELLGLSVIDEAEPQLAQATSVGVVNPDPFAALAGNFYQSTPSARGQFGVFDPNGTAGSPAWVMHENENDSPAQESREPVGGSTPAEVMKYVDDTNITEVLDLTTAERHTTTARSRMSLKARSTEQLMNNIITRANTIGMRVNSKKNSYPVFQPTERLRYKCDYYPRGPGNY